MIMNRFETIFADTAFARSLHFHLRYQVFCEEARFEDASQFPDQREYDDYDKDAVHFIVWDRLAHLWVGAMRLVPAAEQDMPCEVIAGKSFIEDAGLRGRSVEFSRLCVPARYRQTDAGFRVGRWAPPGVEDSEGEIVFFRQREQEIFQRLLYASFAWGGSKSIDYCYFIINRALARMLKRFGIPLEAVGEPLEHRGVRIPHRYHVEAAHAGMRAQSASYAEMADSAPAYIAFSELETQYSDTGRPETVVHRFPPEVATAAQAQAEPQPQDRRWSMMPGNTRSQLGYQVA